MGNFIKLIFGNQIFKSTIIYTIGDSIGKAIPFILLPIITRYLTPTDYGVLTNFSVLVQIFTAICALNTYSALTVSYYKLDNDSLSSYLSNLLYLIVFLASICMVVSLLFTNYIYRYSGIPTLWQNLALLSAVATCVFTLYTSLLRMQNRVFQFNGVQISQSLLSAVLAIGFVVFLKWNWQGRVLSIVIAASISMLLSLVLMRKARYLFKKININEMKEAFFFGLPLLPHTLSFWFKSGMDKIIITNYIGFSANGVYSIAVTLGGIIGIFTGSFFNAYTPLMFKDLSIIDISQENEAITIKKKLVKITYLFTAVLLAVCIGSYFIMKFAIPLLFTGEYLDAIQLMPLVMTTIYFEGMYSIVSGYIFYRKKTKILGAITFLSSMVQILMTLFFVKNFGIMGALYSSSIVSLITFLFVLSYTNKIYELPWGLKRTPAPL